MSETSLALAFGAMLVAPVMLVALLLELRDPAGPGEQPVEVPAPIEQPAVEALDPADVSEDASADELDEEAVELPRPTRVGSMLATTWS